MPNKSLSLYSPEDAIEDNVRLVVEVAKNHLACVVTKENRKAISAFELFTFTESEAASFDELLAGITQQSKLLSIKIASVHVYINNEYCIPVPIFKFNKETAEEYLQIAFGTACPSKTHYEHLPVEPGIINVYRISQNWLQWFDKQFEKCSFHHTYSNIIRSILSVSDEPEELMTVNFYNTFFIVAVIKDAVLQLIQTFVYDSPEDVLYYLLNITKQFELYSKTLTIQISGMIDVDYKLYRELITYFKEVKVENVHEANLKLDFGEYPHHYFTPFFNLAL